MYEPAFRHEKWKKMKKMNCSMHIMWALVSSYNVLIYENIQIG